MNSMSLLAFFLIGLAGSVHCAGMCGGIVAALAAPAPFPVPVRRLGGAHAPTLLRGLAYNSGRIASYALAGALAGGASRAAVAVAGMASLSLLLYWLANLMLLALGLYVSGLWRGLARLERAGQSLWRHLAPATRTFIPMDRPWKALAAGALWGWLPCGMVYSVLASAMLSGSAGQGAAIMLAFGLGTLPAVLGLGLLGAPLQRWSRAPLLRAGVGAVIGAFGVVGLLRAAQGMTAPWVASLCATPWTLP